MKTIPFETAEDVPDRTRAALQGRLRVDGKLVSELVKKELAGKSSG